jgi:hypothetical protein
VCFRTGRRRSSARPRPTLSTARPTSSGGLWRSASSRWVSALQCAVPCSALCPAVRCALQCAVPCSALCPAVLAEPPQAYRTHRMRDTAHSYPPHVIQIHRRTIRYISHTGPMRRVIRECREPVPLAQVVGEPAYSCTSMPDIILPIIYPFTGAIHSLRQTHHHRASDAEAERARPLPHRTEGLRGDARGADRPLRPPAGGDGLPARHLRGACLMPRFRFRMH